MARANEAFRFGKNLENRRLGFLPQRILKLGMFRETFLLTTNGFKNRNIGRRGGKSRKILFLLDLTERVFNVKSKKLMR